VLLARPSGNQIRVPKAAEIIAQRIRKSIVRGELKTGDYLPAEAQLLETYEVSRPTLREAIRILEVEGLLSISRGARRGARFYLPSIALNTRPTGSALQLQGTTIGDVYEARTVIEPAAARLAAERRPKEAAEALREQIKREQKAFETKDLASARHEVAMFHEVLMEQSGNGTITIIATALKDIVERQHAVVYSGYTDVDERVKVFHLAFRSHERLAKLVEQGDGPGAEAHWIKHMKGAGALWPGGAANTSVVDVLD
jgi:DNA-binding FadR family transcriptional regulator